MAYFNPPETTEVKLSDPNYWVKIKKQLTFGEAKNFISVTSDGSINQTAALEAFMKAAIVEWNLDDGDGNIAPIDDEHINLLSQEDATTIIQAAGAAVAGDEQDKADFLDESVPSSTPDK